MKCGTPSRLGLLRLCGWAVLAMVLLTLWPERFGGQAGYTVVAGTSMEPGLRTGDLVVTWPAEDYGVGDTIVYSVPGYEDYRVIHRITQVSADVGYETQGDNRPAPDPWRPTTAEIVGRQMLHLPGVGHLLAALLSPWILAALAAGWVFVTVARPASPGVDDPRVSAAPAYRLRGGEHPAVWQELDRGRGPDLGG